MRRNIYTLAICPLVLIAAAQEGLGHEVDQYSVPVRESLLDLGGHWNQLVYRVIARGVQHANQNIAVEKNAWLPDVGGMRLAKSQSPAALAKCVRQQLPSAKALIENIEHELAATNLRDLLSGRRIAYRAEAEKSVYLEGPKFPDLRYWNRLVFMRCSTIRVHGHYFGTDKIGHFFAMGYHYYTAYQAIRLMGQSHNMAMQKACDICGSVTENSFLGITSTAIYSNADMATNYIGLKFYLNLTQPVKLAGRMVPAMVVRDGDYWKLGEHLAPDSRLFAEYVSVHWDEVLNPCHLEETFREQTRKAIQYRKEHLLDWYAGSDPRRRTSAYFNNILQHARTYYGEDYGHSGDLANLLGLGSVCFDDRSPVPEQPVIRTNLLQQPWTHPVSNSNHRPASNPLTGSLASGSEIQTKPATLAPGGETGAQVFAD